MSICEVEIYNKTLNISWVEIMYIENVIFPLWSKVLKVSDVSHVLKK